MNYKLDFYLDKATGDEKPIFLYVKRKSEKWKIYTGYKVKPVQWDIVRQRITKNAVVNGLTAEFLNRKLEALKAEANKIYEKEQEILKESFKAKLLKYLGRSKSEPLAVGSGWDYYFEEYFKNAEIVPGRVRQMKVTFKAFREFLKDEREISTITAETIELFRIRLNEGDRGNNTVSNNLKRLRAFFSFAKKRKWISVHPFDGFKIPMEEYGEPIALSKTELDKLYKFDLCNNPRLEKVRDIFVFQCCIGCRVGDLLRLTKNNIIGNFIQYVPTKTNKESSKPVKVPLNDKARAILDKYRCNEGLLLPKISDVKYNLYLKELFKFCGLDRIIMRINQKTRKEEPVSLATIASSHLARRTFISILHKKVKDSVIVSMTGHVAGSKAFARYYSVDEKQKTDAVNII